MVDYCDCVTLVPNNHYFIVMAFVGHPVLTTVDEPFYLFGTDSIRVVLCAAQPYHRLPDRVLGNYCQDAEGSDNKVRRHPAGLAGAIPSRCYSCRPIPGW